MWFAKISFFIFFLALGLFFLIKTEPWVRMVGHNNLAEKYLGQGGTYTAWRIIGSILLVLALLIIFGKFDWLFRDIMFPEQAQNAPSFQTPVENSK